MLIAIDLDSTLTYFLESTLNKYNFLYDDILRPEDIKDWNLEGYLKCTKQQMYDLWTPKFMKNIPFRDGARTMIDKLKSKGHEVFLVTAYHRSRCQVKVDICEDVLGLNESDIIFCTNKYRVACDILIDDGLHNFYDKDGLPIKAEKIVFDQPYNRNSNGLGWHYRVKDLNEVVGIVDIIEKNKKYQKNIIVR